MIMGKLHKTKVREQERDLFQELLNYNWTIKKLVVESSTLQWTNWFKVKNELLCCMFSSNKKVALENIESRNKK